MHEHALTKVHSVSVAPLEQPQQQVPQVTGGFTWDAGKEVFWAGEHYTKLTQNITHNTQYTQVSFI